MSEFSASPCLQDQEQSSQEESQRSQPCSAMQPETSPANPTNRVRSRRRLKSALFFAFGTLSVLLAPSETLAFSTANRSGLSQRRSEWISRSVEYYSTVMRKNRGGQSQRTTQMDSTSAASDVLATKGQGGGNQVVADEYDRDFIRLATNHYYARSLIKEGKWTFAEKIYRRMIAELSEEQQDGGECDQCAKLAVSTLLLALHLQRMGDVKATRALFLQFFRRLAVKEEEMHQCTCSAKVVQAYALFEMKNGHAAKSLEIIRRAVQMDEELRPVLGWKQFRDAAAGRKYVPTISLRKGGQMTKNGALAP